MKEFDITGKRFRIVCCGMFMLLAICCIAPARADQTVTQSYSADGSLPKASLVSLKSGSTTSVEPATNDNVKNLLGVVTSTDNSFLTLMNGGQNQVNVATSGLIPVLVSDVNGDVSSGDQITASPIPGVGMKATDNTKVVGVAQDNLGDSQGKKTQDYTDSKGKKATVTLGQINVLVNVSYYYKQPDKTIIPPVIQNIANALAGKKVNPAPIIISLVIFIGSIISIVMLIYAAIRSSIISIGRNPMSQSAVIRSLIQIGGLIFLILGGSVASIYLILAKV